MFIFNEVRPLCGSIKDIKVEGDACCINQENKHPRLNLWPWSWTFTV